MTVKTHFTKEEWRAVAIEVNPAISREMFDRMWEDFSAAQDRYHDAMMADDPEKLAT